MTICLVLLLLPVSLHAQGLLWATNFPRYRYSVELTGDKHFVPGLVRMQDVTQHHLVLNGVPAQQVSSFPPYWGIRLNVSRLAGDFENFRWGLSLGSSSTGSRVGYADASSTILVDQRASFRTLSILIENDLHPSFDTYDEWSFEPAFDARGGLTYMTHEQHERVYTARDSEQNRTASWALLPTAEAGLSLRMQRRKRFAQIRASYFVMIRTPLRRSDDTPMIFATGDKMLSTASGVRVSSWNHGLRLSLSVGLQTGFE